MNNLNKNCAFYRNLILNALGLLVLNFLTLLFVVVYVITIVFLMFLSDSSIPLLSNLANGLTKIHLTSIPELDNL